MNKALPFALIAVILFSGCLGIEKGTQISVNFSSNVSAKERSLFSISENNDIVFEPTDFEIVKECIELCIKEKEAGKSFESGPCLSDKNEDWPINGYVCDVVSFPRNLEIDNNRKNQCKDYIELRASKFIEVSKDCELVRVV